MRGHDIFVIGASAGGVDALSRLIGALPADLPASVFIVLHLSPDSPSLLPAILARLTRLTVTAAQDGAEIADRRVYVCPPDRHMLIERGRVRVVHGPKENLHRPAADPLFRSAAWTYGPRVVGVVLTGARDDGAAGLWAIKTCGGVTVVQDPATAAFPEMPSSALASVEIDHCLPLEGIPPLLARLARQPGAGAQPGPTEETKLAMELPPMDRDIEDMSVIGPPSAFTCPSCGGALWEMQEDQLLRYRCHTGHKFSPESLVTAQSEQIEQSLYSSLRSLKELAGISERLADRFAGKHPEIAARHRAKAQDLERQAETVLGLLSGEPSLGR
jgi:two-component system chemotaxis response regulator CheB